MTDEELLGYATHHARTDVAEFHKDHVKRLFELAGVAPSQDFDARAFWRIEPEVADELVRRARERMRDAAYAAMDIDDGLYIRKP